MEFPSQDNCRKLDQLGFPGASGSNDDNAFIAAHNLHETMSVVNLLLINRDSELTSYVYD